MHVVSLLAYQISSLFGTELRFKIYELLFGCKNRGYFVDDFIVK